MDASSQDMKKLETKQRDTFAEDMHFMEFGSGDLEVTITIDESDSETEQNQCLEAPQSETLQNTVPNPLNNDKNIYNNHQHAVIENKDDYTDTSKTTIFTVIARNILQLLQYIQKLRIYDLLKINKSDPEYEAALLEFETAKTRCFENNLIIFTKYNLLIEDIQLVWLAEFTRTIGQQQSPPVIISENDAYKLCAMMLHWIGQKLEINKKRDKTTPHMLTTNNIPQHNDIHSNSDRQDSAVNALNFINSKNITLTFPNESNEAAIKITFDPKLVFKNTNTATSNPTMPLNKINNSRVPRKSCQQTFLTRQIKSISSNTNQINNNISPASLNATSEYSRTAMTTQRPPPPTYSETGNSSKGNVDQQFSTIYGVNVPQISPHRTQYSRDNNAMMQTKQINSNSSNTCQFTNNITPASLNPASSDYSRTVLGTQRNLLPTYSGTGNSQGNVRKTLKISIHFPSPQSLTTNVNVTIVN